MNILFPILVGQLIVAGFFVKVTPGSPRVPSLIEDAQNPGIVGLRLRAFTQIVSAFLFDGSVVRTSTGSRDLIDLENAVANTRSNAYKLVFPEGSRFTLDLRPLTTGYVFLSGAKGLRASYTSLEGTNEVLHDVDTKSVIGIDISTLIGPIQWRRTSQLRDVNAFLWFDVTRVPTEGQFQMVAMLDTTHAFVLSITSANDTVKIIKNYLFNSTVTEVKLRNETGITPTKFLEILNEAFNAHGISVAFASGTRGDRQLRWTSTVSVKFPVQSSAVAATLGLYSVDTNGAHEIELSIDVLINPASELSPQISHIQWPFSWPLLEIPGFCLMNYILTRFWTRQQQVEWTNEAVGFIGKSYGTTGLIRTENSDLFFDLTENDYTLYDDTDEPITSYVPMGPHDNTFPDTSTVRLMDQDEDNLLNNGMTVCILDDGQNLDHAIGSLLVGHDSQGEVRRQVIGARRGPSLPLGRAAAIYLDLNTAVSGPLLPSSWLWFISFDDTPSFASGIPMQGSAGTPWIRSTPVPESLSSLLTETAYATLKYVDFEAPLTWTDTIKLPNADGLDYIRNIWPASLSFLSFVRPTKSPLSAPRTSQTVQFSTPGQYAYSMPSDATRIDVYAFGAGGAAEANHAGADGSFARGSFRYTSSSLDVFVGYPGGAPASNVLYIYGGSSYDNSKSLGGGLSGIFKSDVPLLVAGGGGSGGAKSSGVSEALADRMAFRVSSNGIVGSAELRKGEKASTNGSGAGGSGYRGGTSGRNLHGGASGSSLVPHNGQSSGALNRQKHWEPGVGHGAIPSAIGMPAVLSLGGKGKIVIEVHYS